MQDSTEPLAAPPPGSRSPLDLVVYLQEGGRWGGGRDDAASGGCGRGAGPFPGCDAGATADGRWRRRSWRRSCRLRPRPGSCTPVHRGAVHEPGSILPGTPSVGGARDGPGITQNLTMVVLPEDPQASPSAPPLGLAPPHRPRPGPRPRPLSLANSTGSLQVTRVEVELGRSRPGSSAPLPVPFQPLPRR